MKLRAILLLCIALALPGALHAQGPAIPADKRAEIERLLEVTRALALGQQFSGFFVTAITQAIRKQNPQVPQHVIDALPEEVNAVVAEGLPAFREMVIPLYAKYFTLDELRGMNAFYSTPLGQKAIAVMPPLLQESMAAGQRWGQALEPRIVQRIRARFKKENLRL